MKPNGLHIALISLHGLIRAKDLELGRDSDTGGQVKYVIELAEALSRKPEVGRVDLITRQIIDERVGRTYAQTQEPINEKACIYRIPFGPRRYLRKESLWPAIDLFVDQAVIFFRRTGGPPDLIHGHYADAGYGGAQLARLMGIPFVFTGHSLGRVKRSRILEGAKTNPERSSELEKRFSFSQRIEAEEFALETASLVVASTQQEVESQYQQYDHYVPERMEVIPPGVDLEKFSNTLTAKPESDISKGIGRFLQSPEKPMILALARPDERKNLDMLLRVYGESEELQELANLVLILGTRTDIAEMPTTQRKVMHTLLSLIDAYDLYGKVAYPKFHQPEEVPLIYRLAAQTGGVFINPAWTEPFGLTLLEAAASGLPIVATNDGGPRDILANCKNGLLIDPYNQEDIEHALIRVLSDPEAWKQWAESGVNGAKSMYSWDTHAERYLRDVREIVEATRKQAPKQRRKSRGRLPQYDRLLVTDIDNTLTGDDEALQDLLEVLEAQHDRVGFGIATGRSLDDVLGLLEELEIPRPDILISAVGTEVHYGDDLIPDKSWHAQINFQWKRSEIRRLLDSIEGLHPQDPKDQSKWKLSYGWDPKVAPSIAEIKRRMRGAGIRAKLVVSHGMYLDVIPVRAGSGLCVRHLTYKWDFPPQKLLVAGDSGNDEEMLRGGTLGVVVGNYSKELEKLRNRPRIYFAQAHHARGILEGIEYYNFFDHITIPNDRFDPEDDTQ